MPQNCGNAAYTVMDPTPAPPRLGMPQTIVPWSIPGYDFGMPRGSTATTSHMPRRSSSALAQYVVTILPFACLLTLSACASPDFYHADIQSEDPADRILAIRAVAEARDASSVPLLVDRLEDEDEAVRFFAILALEKITGRRFGYDYSMPDTARRKAVERWRAYVHQGRKGVAAGGEGTGPAEGASSAGSPEARRTPVPSQ